MKKHMSGFVPVNFHGAGKVLFVIGVVCIVVYVLGLFVQIELITNAIFYFGLAALILSIYLLFVVPKEK